MTRGNARELAVHLIYGREFTGEEPEQVVATRLNKEYYSLLSDENQVYSDRPSGQQRNYIDNVVSGVANRSDELNELIQKYSISYMVQISEFINTLDKISKMKGTYTTPVTNELRLYYTENEEEWEKLKSDVQKRLNMGQ